MSSKETFVIPFSLGCNNKMNEFLLWKESSFSYFTLGLVLYWLKTDFFKIHASLKTVEDHFHSGDQIENSTDFGIASMGKALIWSYCHLLIH